MCPAGCFLSNLNCSQCPAGSYNVLSGQSSCSDCPAGSYCNSSGLTSPVICPAGSYCLAKSVTPVICDLGFLCAQEGLSQQSPCPSGHYCPSSVQDVPCPAGTFSSATGAVSGLFMFTSACNPACYFPHLRAPELILVVSAGQTSVSTCQPCSSSQSCPEGTSNPTAGAVSSDTTAQIVAYVLSAVGALIFILVAVFVIKARVAKLRAAGIQPTLKRVVYLQKTLSKYRPLLEPGERNGSLQVVAQVMTPDARTARLVAEANAQSAK